MTNLEKEIDSILRFGLPDDYNEHQRKLILPRLVKWHKAKVKKLTIPVVGKRLLEMEEAGKEATSLIAHLKDQHGFNDVEEEAQDKIMKVFKYEGRW